MLRRVGPILLLLLIPGLAAAQDPKAKVPAVNKLPAVTPRVTPQIPDTTESKDESLPTEDVELRYEPVEQDYKEQPKSRQGGKVPGRYPISDPDTRLDDLRIVRIDPRGGEVSSVAAGGGGPGWTEEESIYVLLEYDLSSVSRAVVAADILAPAGARSTGYQRTEGSDWVDRGSGRMEKRLAISCAPDSPERIRGLRLQYWMAVPTAGDVTRLVEKVRPLPHAILCKDTLVTPGPAARPGERVPQPSFDDRPAAARADDQIKTPDRPVSPPAAARADDVLRRPAPPIDPGIAKRLPPEGLDPGVVERLGACADPATVELYPRLRGRTDPSRGVGLIEIIGIVRNIGRGAYVSDPRQQSVDLFEEQPGTPPRAVASQTFTNLAPDGTVRLVHNRGWDTSTEFLPRYRLRIVYEPDIRTDANPRNDDCGLANNEAVLEPEQINALFR